MLILIWSELSRIVIYKLAVAGPAGRLRICKYLSFLGNTITCNKTIKWNQITKGRREVVKEKISDNRAGKLKRK